MDRDEVKSLKTLNRVMRALLEVGDVEQLLDRIMGEVLAALGAERGYLVLRNADRMEVKAVRNWSRDAIDGGEGEVSRSIVQEALDKNAAIRLEDAMTSVFAGAESVQAMQLRSILAAPLPSAQSGRPLGVVYLETRATSKFSAADQALLEEVLELAGAVLAEVVRRHTVEERARTLESALLARDRFPGIITHEPAMIEVLKLVAQIAPSEVPVLVLGESGTGKELVARALQLNSKRSRGPFVTVNCGAFSESLLESELFGHEKGGFTGATRDRAGMIGAADGGTLFLDEVGEMSPPLQVKLLRAIQFGEYRPVGSDETKRANVRFVSATHRNLEDDVKQGRFRQDLLYRLNTVTIEIPPLRERIDDIPLLFRAFAERVATREGRPIPELSPALLEQLERYAWPGNVRELENEVERLLALSAGQTGPLEPTLLSQRVRFESARQEESNPRFLSTRVDHEERAAIVEALERESQNRTRAAKRLGVSRETLRIKMRKHGIE